MLLPERRNMNEVIEPISLWEDENQLTMEGTMGVRLKELLLIDHEEDDEEVVIYNGLSLSKIDDGSEDLNSKIMKMSMREIDIDDSENDLDSICDYEVDNTDTRSWNLLNERNIPRRRFLPRYPSFYEEEQDGKREAEQIHDFESDLSITEMDDCNDIVTDEICECNLLFHPPAELDLTLFPLQTRKQEVVTPEQFRPIPMISPIRETTVTIQVQDSLRKLESSMRRSDVTRMMVKRQRLEYGQDCPHTAPHQNDTIDKKAISVKNEKWYYQLDSFASSSSLQSYNFDQDRLQIYQMIELGLTKS